LNIYIIEKKLPLKQAIEKTGEKLFKYFSFILEKRLELADIISETNYTDILNEFRNQNKCLSSNSGI